MEKKNLARSAYLYRPSARFHAKRFPNAASKCWHLKALSDVFTPASVEAETLNANANGLAVNIASIFSKFSTFGCVFEIVVLEMKDSVDIVELETFMSAVGVALDWFEVSL